MVWLYTFFIFWSGSCSEQKGIPLLFSSPRWTVPACRTSPCMSCVLTPNHPGSTQSTHSINVRLYWDQNSVHHFRCSIASAKWTGRITLLDLTVTHVSMQPWLHLASLLEWHVADSCLTWCQQGHVDLLWQNCFSDSLPQTLMLHAIIPSRNQDWVFSYWSSQGSCGSFLQGLLKSSLSLHWIDHSSKFGVIHKSGERSHYLIILVIDEDIKQCLCQSWS